MKTFITILLLALLNSSACTNAKEDTTTTSATKTVTTFTDVNEQTNYHEAIEYLKSNNIVEGYADGTFKPENKINRAELLKILLEIKDKEDINQANLSNCFIDVKNEWFATYVCYAKDKGIIKGYADGSFKPEQNIAFTEASKMITNIMGLEVAKVEENAPWYKQYVLPLTENKRVPRSITTFDKEITRGEMAEMVWRVREEEKSEDFIKFSELDDRTNNPFLSDDQRNIFLNSKILLSVDNDTIFNWFKIDSSLCTEYSMNNSIKLKQFCEDKNVFRDQTKFNSIIVSPDKMQIGFTVESDILSPDTVVGIFLQPEKKVYLLTSYYLGNNFISFSPNGNYFVYQGSCWESLCGFVIKNSKTLSETLSINNPETADLRSNNSKFIRWISENEIEYQLGTEVRQESFLDTSTFNCDSLTLPEKILSQVNYIDEKNQIWNNYKNDTLGIEFYYLLKKNNEQKWSNFLCMTDNSIQIMEIKNNGKVVALPIKIIFLEKNEKETLESAITKLANINKNNCKIEITKDGNMEKARIGISDARAVNVFSNTGAIKDELINQSDLTYNDKYDVSWMIFSNELDECSSYAGGIRSMQTTYHFFLYNEEKSKKKYIFVKGLIPPEVFDEVIKPDSIKLY